MRDKEHPDWPLPSFDAHDWAEAFCKKNEDLMRGWFANALMRGFDEGRSAITKLEEKYRREVKHLEEVAASNLGLTHYGKNRVWQYLEFLRDIERVKNGDSI